MTLSQLANLAGISKSYLSSIERHLALNPSVHLLEKIATALGLSPEYFLSSKEPPDMENIDPDWMSLMQEIADCGVSKSLFREFLEFKKYQMNLRK